ncbi:hypothetical protein D0Z00_004324 [Geotrichum galactomycetum]|uniref:Uncharacterized protein n=1 Tax=Geotrichum galactomycetum TaxID=27317 RepID=A0ACB6UYR7_9ASCO|nr:hypothetical protein D0Z00_004324 [Geotrichum candidum]
MKEKLYTIVIKLGTSSLCDEKTYESRIANMSLIVETVVKLRRDGHRVIIVSSGGIAVGLKRMKLARRPKHLSSVQAVAAIGQARLIGLWDDLFRQLEQPIAQILLTRNDIADRTQYLNAANTMNSLLNMGVVPIVNENDTLSVSEIRFGDNDTLSGITAGMVNADYLFLMTDVDCLYTDNPRVNPDATPILIVDNIAKLRVDVSSAGSNVGTGGMTTKLIAAELATSAGVTTIICKSSVPGNIHAIVRYLQTHEDPVPTPANLKDGDDENDEITSVSLENDPEAQERELEQLARLEVPPFTRFLRKDPIKDREFWILHGVASHGSLYIDHGAYRAITRSNKAGLLPVGVIEVRGHFHTLECVEIYVAQRDKTTGKLDESVEPLRIGGALVNYSSTEIGLIMGQQSSLIEETLGFADSEYIAYRDNMAFYKGKKAHEVLPATEIRELERGITNL